MIRDAEASDLPAILEITNHAILNTTAIWTLTAATLSQRQAWFAERQAAGFPVLVADRDGAVAAYASFGAFRPHEGYLHTVEHSIYVAPQAQGGGIGRALLAALLSRGRALGKHAMIGGIEAGNAPSLAMHARAGFTETGRLPEVGRKFDRWLDLVFMQKLLGAAT